MNSIEILKRELQEQKSAIETKGGHVTVSNTNVSPAEITSGIKSIPAVDFSNCTATEADVLTGKTFYAGNNTMKTGSLVVSQGGGGDQNLIDYVMYCKTSDTYPNLEIHIPDYVSKIKDYLFYGCNNKCDVYLNTALTEVGSNAFYQCMDMNVHGLNNAINLSTTGTNSFRDAKGIDLSALPSSLSSIGNYTFANCAKHSNSIALPGNISSLGSYVFSCDATTPVQSIDLSNAPNVTYSIYLFQYIQCLSDVTIPEGITTISSYFNYNGSMKNVIFPTTLTKLSSYSFNAKDFVPLEDLITESYTFNSTTPPSIPTTSFCSRLLDRTSNHVKFYVPDGSIEAYKALSAIKPFANYVFPISQKP